MHFDVKKLVAVLATFLFAAVLWASSRMDSTDYDVTKPTEIGNTQLMPGHYMLKASESVNQLRVLQDGKVLATVPCHWVKLDHKADDSEILTNANRVTRVEFKGRTEAASAR